MTENVGNRTGKKASLQHIAKSSATEIYSFSIKKKFSPIETFFLEGTITHLN